MIAKLFFVTACIAMMFMALTEGARLRNPPPCKFQNIAFEGHDIPDIKPSAADTYDDCQATCIANEACAFFTFAAGNKTCTLQTSNEGKKAQDGSVSASKACKPIAVAPAAPADPVAKPADDAAGN